MRIVAPETSLPQSCPEGSDLFGGFDSGDEGTPRLTTERENDTRSRILGVPDTNQIVTKGCDFHAVAIIGAPGTLIPMCSCEVARFYLPLITVSVRTGHSRAGCVRAPLWTCHNDLTIPPKHIMDKVPFYARHMPEPASPPSGGPVRFQRQAGDSRCSPEPAWTAPQPPSEPPRAGLVRSPQRTP